MIPICTCHPSPLLTSFVVLSHDDDHPNFHSLDFLQFHVYLDASMFTSKLKATRSRVTQPPVLPFDRPILNDPTTMLPLPTM